MKTKTRAKKPGAKKPRTEPNLREKARALSQRCSKACAEATRQFGKTTLPGSEPDKEQVEKLRQDLQEALRGAALIELLAAPHEVVAYLCAEIMMNTVIKAYRDRAETETIYKQVAEMLGPLVEAMKQEQAKQAQEQPAPHKNAGDGQ